MMFSKEEYLQRLANVKKSMEEKGIEVLLITDPANMCYVMGHNAWSFYVHQMVVIALDEDLPIFIGRYMDAFAGVSKLTYLDEDHVYAYPDYYVQNPDCHPMEFIADVLKERGHGNKTIGVEMDTYYFTAMALEKLKAGMPDAKFVNGDLLVNWVRIIKSEAEIELVRRAGVIADKGMQAGVDAIAPGVRQCDVSAAVHAAMYSGTPEFGGDYTGLMLLMPSGDTAGVPHLTWTDDPYPDDTYMFFELAGCHQRYHCPMSRTLTMGKGGSTDKVREYAKYAIEGLQAALDQVKPGNTCEEVEAAWRNTMKKYGVEKESRIGYSTGLNYPPDWGEHTASLRPGDKTILQPNMIFHCIPGMYYTDFGVSISQCIRVTETGYERMSNYPFDLIEK